MMEGPVGKIRSVVKIRKEITPHALRCTIGHCPAVLTLSDGDLLVIGKKLPADLSKEVQNRIGDDEFAIKISPEFFKNLRK
jgi:hypothetical protein